MTSRPAASRRTLAHSPFRTDKPAIDSTVYAVGDRVCHDRHGVGRVVSVEEPPAVVVNFGDGGLVRIVLPSAKLSPL